MRDCVIFMWFEKMIMFFERGGLQTVASVTRTWKGGHSLHAGMHLSFQWCFVM